MSSTGVIILNEEQLTHALQYLAKKCPDEYSSLLLKNPKLFQAMYDPVGHLTIDVFNDNKQLLETVHLSVEAGLDANYLNAFLIQDSDRVTDYGFYRT